MIGLEDHAAMTQSRPSLRRHPRAAVLLALAWLLAAVLPHATLAATVPAAGHAVHAAADAADRHHGDAPCGQDEAGSPESPLGAPSCCILGCGLLAQALQMPGLSGGAVPGSLAPAPPEPLRGEGPEPAERPPPRSATA
jgi:uncharacterized low-complexity protein